MTYSFERNRIRGGLAADDEYWTWLERGEFRMPTCDGCGRLTWPAHYRCAKCGGWDFTWAPHPAKGMVYGWTRTWYLFDRIQQRRDDIPYVTVIAEIDNANGGRVIGVLKGSEEGLRFGAPVVGSIDPPSSKTLGYPALRWSLSSSTPTAERAGVNRRGR